MKTAMQLKAHVNNLSKSTGIAPQTLFMNYAIECFLKRISLSKYKQHFILKGGILIAYTIGFNARGTMDLDGTISGYPVSADSLKIMLEDIIAIDANDSLTFDIKSINQIREESEYGGLRVSLSANLEKMTIPIKLDVSTGDSITPRPIEFSHKLMFTEEYIEILAYNIETILAEKYETIISRSIENTRMRDYYDVFILTQTQPYNKALFRSALERTAENRHSLKFIENAETVVTEIKNNSGLLSLWQNYQKKYDYARDISWDMVISAVSLLNV